MFCAYTKTVEAVGKENYSFNKEREVPIEKDILSGVLKLLKECGTGNAPEEVSCRKYRAAVSMEILHENYIWYETEKLIMSKFLHEFVTNKGRILETSEEKINMHYNRLIKITREAKNEKYKQWIK